LIAKCMNGPPANEKGAVSKGGSPFSFVEKP
jgi:hypothetical protein